MARAGAAGKYGSYSGAADLTGPARSRILRLVELETAGGIEAALRDYIDRTVLHGQGSDVTRTTALFDLGILDSFGLFSLVFFIEERFGVSLPLESLTPEDVHDIGSIATLVHTGLRHKGRLVGGD